MTFLIAEIGINHNGDIEIAKQLIDIAKKHGWNAVKFQKRTIDTVYTKEYLDSPRESPWGTTQREQKEGLEFGKKEYDIIDTYCKEIGIEWFASAWDIESLKFLDKYNLKYNKIASAMNTYQPLLKYVAKQKKKTFISTGMSTGMDIGEAIKIFVQRDCPFVLMHCVGIYPCPLDKLNINRIKQLKGDWEVGYSGHSNGAMDAVIAAVLGAEYIEKHITLDRSMYGSDQSASIEPAGMEFIAKHCSHISIMLGENTRLEPEKEEMENAKKLRYWE